MQIRELLSNDDAVSPVIGVILMVAITVILAAVIASFVLGLGGSTEATPQASFSFDFQSSTSTSALTNTGGSGDNGDLTITHDGGDTIEAAALSVTDGSATLDGGTGVFASSGTEITAGNSDTVAVDSTDTIRVVYTSDSGDSSTTLTTYDGPQA